VNADNRYVHAVEKHTFVLKLCLLCVPFPSPVLARLKEILSANEKELLWKEYTGAMRTAPVHPHPEVIILT
jgi:hypothetical protein